MNKPTTIQAICEEFGVGVIEAKTIAKRRELLREIRDANTLDHLKDVLTVIVKDLYPEPRRPVHS